MAKKKARHAGKSSKPMDPKNHPAHDLKNLPTDQHDGTQLGMDPQQAAMPQTMGMPSQYPGQDIGA